MVLFPSSFLKIIMGVIEEAHNLNIVGSGEQVVVLGHGFGTDQSVWKHLVPHLVDDYRIVVFDIMGAGTTNPDYFDFQRYSTIEGWAYDLLAILQHLQISSCIYVGHSLSAITGLIASIIRPDFFLKLLLLSASPSEDYYGGFEEEDIKEILEAMKSNYGAWCRGFAPLAVGGDMRSAAVQEFSRTCFNMRPDIALNIMQIIFELDTRPILGLVTVPCHILQSAHDMVVPVVVSEFLQQNLGGKTIVEVMESEGHLPQLSAPDVVIPVILRHIRHDIAD